MIEWVGVVCFVTFSLATGGLALQLHTALLGTDLNELRPVEQFQETNGKSSYKPYLKINLVKIMLAYSEISNKVNPTRT